MDGRREDRTWTGSDGSSHHPRISFVPGDVAFNFVRERESAFFQFEVVRTESSLLDEGVVIVAVVLLLLREEEGAEEEAAEEEVVVSMAMYGR